jgi:hypothetical protein
MMLNRSIPRSFAQFGSLFLALGLLPAMVLVYLIASCFDTCADAPRTGVFFMFIFLIPGLASSAIAWFMSVQQAFSHRRSLNHFAAYILPTTSALLFVALTSSLAGNMLFPRTYSKHDAWMYVWFFMIGLFILWSLTVLYWNRPTERRQNVVQTTRARVFRYIRYIGLFMLNPYLGLIVAFSVFLVDIKEVVPAETVTGIIVFFGYPVPQGVLPEAEDFATIFFYIATGSFVLLTSLWIIGEEQWQRQASRHQD